MKQMALILVGLTLIIVAAIGCFGHLPTHFSRDDRYVFKRISDSAVTVDFATGTGSGTVIYADPKRSLVLTCAHVVLSNGKDDKDLTGLQVISKQGERSVALPAFVFEADASRDLAVLIVVGNLGLPPMKLALHEPDLFATLYAVASPLALRGTAAHELLTNKHVLFTARNRDVYQLTGFALPGSSGGTIANADGELVGVIEAIQAVGPVAQSSIVFAIPLPEIEQFLMGYKL